MGSSTAFTDPTTPTPAPPVNKYPHVPVQNGTVEFYSEISGIKGNFVSRFAIRTAGDKVSIENLSFPSDPLNIDAKAFHSSKAPLLLTSAVYLTLDDYRKSRSIPLTDVTGALGI